MENPTQMPFPGPDAPMPELCPTADGSMTLYRPDLDEHYHSVCGAATESRHVYIDCGLRHWLEKTPGAEVRILEIGFGTGLDAMLVAAEAESSGRHMAYTGIDIVKLPAELTEQLGMRSIVGNRAFEEVTSAPWNASSAIVGGLMTIEKIEADAKIWLEREVASRQFDVIFMDAFAPEKQPDLWTPQFIGLLAGILAPGGVMTTYCAKGAVRRAFTTAGLTAERLAGPSGGKREILRLSRPASLPTQNSPCQ